MNVLKQIPASYNNDIEKAIKILKENGCTEIYIFGSLVDGTYNLNSDIDFAVRGCFPDKYYYVVGKLLSELEHLVDIVNLDSETKFVTYLINKGELMRVA